MTRNNAREIAVHGDVPVARRAAEGRHVPGLRLADLENQPAARRKRARVARRDVPVEREALLPGDERFAAVLDLFASRAFRRDLTALLPGAVQTHTPRAGDFRWDIFFTFPQTPLADGSVVSGELLHCENFFGRVRLSFDGNEIAVTGAQENAWAPEVLAAGRGG